MHDLQICCAACMPAIAITSRQSRSSTLMHCSLWYVRITYQMTLRCDHSGYFHKCCRTPDICHCYTVSSDRSGHLYTWAARHRIQLILSLSVCKANHHMSLRETTNAQGTLSRWACLGQKCSSDWRMHVKHQARHHCTEVQTLWWVFGKVWQYQTWSLCPSAVPPQRASHMRCMNMSLVPFSHFPARKTYTSIICATYQVSVSEVLDQTCKAIFSWHLHML